MWLVFRSVLLYAFAFVLMLFIMCMCLSAQGCVDVLAGRMHMAHIEGASVVQVSYWLIVLHYILWLFVFRFTRVVVGQNKISMPSAYELSVGSLFPLLLLVGFGPLGMSGYEIFVGAICVPVLVSFVGVVCQLGSSRAKRDKFGVYASIIAMCLMVSIIGAFLWTFANAICMVTVNILFVVVFVSPLLFVAVWMYHIDKDVVHRDVVLWNRNVFSDYAGVALLSVISFGSLMLFDSSVVGWVFRSGLFWAMLWYVVVTYGSKRQEEEVCNV